MKDIIFVSEIQDPKTKGSSTQIMTCNILLGFKENNIKVHFLAIIDDDCDADSVMEYYSKLVDNITIINSKLQLRMVKGKYKKLIKLILFSIKSPQYGNEIKNLNINRNTLIISHSPSIESIIISKQIKERNNDTKYYEYWSDPICISGIYPEQINYKRFPYYLIEKRMLKYCDEIIYGTKTLYKFQKLIFNNFSEKMRYVDISFNPNNCNIKHINKEEEMTFGYTGQYYEKYRNIKPLYEAFLELKTNKLIICGDSDISIKSNSNIEIINERYSQSNISIIEEQIDVIIVILNSNCIQIPGKVFYHTNTEKTILVILDGKYSSDIKEYLESFERFEFCDNNKESIKNAVKKIINKNYSVNLNKINLLSPKKISRDICKF